MLLSAIAIARIDYWSMGGQMEIRVVMEGLDVVILGTDILKIIFIAGVSFSEEQTDGIYL